MALNHIACGFIFVAACCCVLSSTCSPEAQAAGTCGTENGNRMLFQRGILQVHDVGGEKVQQRTAHGEIVSVDDFEGVSEGERHSLGPGTSCIDGKTKWTRVTPDEISQKGNPQGVVEKCTENVGWEQSAYIKDLMAKYGDDPEEFKFKVCWDKAWDKEKRAFPWLHANTRDWTYHLEHEGSVIVQPMNLNPLWLKGYANIMPDALDYFARMGEVAKRKIRPRFMLYGYSKGASCNWKMGRWRSDLVQAVVSVSGFVSDKEYTSKPEVRAPADGSSPYFFTASPNDTYTPKAPMDADKQFNKQKTFNSGYLSVSHDFPCGHHPDQCFPLCDFNEIFTKPFWAFVRTSEEWRGCPHWKTKGDCDTYLCKWDSELESCDMLHPTELNPSCERFCFKILVDTCREAPDCESSYRMLSVEEAAAKGMHVACKLDGETCVDSEESFQCFFQDQCPKSSCMDETVMWKEVQPEQVRPTGNPHSIIEQCQDNVDWEKSEYLLGLMYEEENEDPEQFMFTVCWDVASDPEERTFPWLHTYTEDWKFFLMHEGSVIIQPMEFDSLWMKGYANIIPDALDYFARMGEVAKRKILPRFMLYGFSKGATNNWDLGRWRPDVVQAVVSVSGMNFPKYYTKNPEVKAKPEGSVPYFISSSPKDTETPRAPQDAKKMFSFTQKTSISKDFTVKHDHPCGQSPDDCSPVCDDFNETYAGPFWTFVRKAETWRGCPHWKTKGDCDTYLCKWDSELESCDMLHPTEMNDSCMRFCSKSKVDTCWQAPDCESSYRMLSVEEAAANGMHVFCKLDGETCVDSEESFQCFYQDQCPVA